jgi:hypothetical protein
VFGLKRVTATVEIEKDAYLTARRIIRRWSRSQAAYGSAGSRYPTTVIPRTSYRRVQRVDLRTGRVRCRSVRRRRAICDQGGLAGGFALVNDGPAFAAQVARAIGQPTRTDCTVERQRRGKPVWFESRRDTNVYAVQTVFSGCTKYLRLSEGHPVMHRVSERPVC